MREPTRVDVEAAERSARARWAGVHGTGTPIDAGAWTCPKCGRVIRRYWRLPSGLVRRMGFGFANVQRHRQACGTET